MSIRVKKRNGKLEDFDVEKIHQVVIWACEGINNVSMSDIEMNAELSLQDKISTTQIHDILIDSANDLISEENPNYQLVASRLLNFKIRKDVWGGHNPPRLYDHIKDCIKSGIYDPSIIKSDKAYSKEEINKLGEYIKHDRDYLFTYSGLQQMVDKYLLKNRNTNVLYETPQFAYILIAMFLFREYDNRIERIKKAYDYFSTFKINLPTPIMAGVRTIKKQFASCVLIDVDDSLNSIGASVNSAAKYTANRAGIGLNIGRIRPINSSIRGGEVIHTGVIPYLKWFESAVKATSQNGIRGGGATISFPFWHYETEDILVLKNNAGTDDNRVRKLDYCIQFSRLFYERLINDQEITLFSPHEAVGLYEAFGNNELFDKLYVEYEKDNSIKIKKKIKARKLAEIFAKERLETGRIYVMNIDHCNENGSWKKPVKMTNLCVEILQPTKPLDKEEDPEAEIGICILSALNLLELHNDDEIKESCEITVRLLNALIDYQEYPILAGEIFTKKRRSLGIGITNLAGFLAKNKLSYHSQDTLEIIDELMEKIQYYLLDSSCKMAEELGECEGFADTKYYDGLCPYDWANTNAKALVQRKPSMDWDGLKNRIQIYGLRNSTVSAIMPCESSSVIQNSTNGIEPVRKLLTYKKAKNGLLKQLVPNFHKNRKYYDMAWDFRNNNSILNVVATLQKWVDMSISTNNYYNYSHYEGGSIPLSTIVKDLVYAYKMGVKTLYYANSPDGDVDATSGCAGGACSI